MTHLSSENALLIDGWREVQIGRKNRGLAFKKPEVKVLRAQCHIIMWREVLKF